MVHGVGGKAWQAMVRCKTPIMDRVRPIVVWLPLGFAVMLVAAGYIFLHAEPLELQPIAIGVLCVGAMLSGIVASFIK